MFSQGFTPVITNDISSITMKTSLPIAGILALLTLSMAATAAAQPVSTQMLTVPGGQIAYDDTGGAGPLVVCVPGLGDVRAQYRFLRPELVRAGYRVATMDLRGMGESTATWNDYSPQAVGSDIIALIDHLGAAHVVVIGNSFAGGAAVSAAAEAPDKVAGLVLIDPFVRAIPTSLPLRALLYVLLTRPWGVYAWSSYYASLYPTSPPPDFADYRAHLKANLSEPGRFAALNRLIDASQAPTEALIPKVKAPTLVIMGSRDSDFSDPAGEANLVANRLHGRAVMIQNAGHYPHAEMPSQTAPHIIEFLREASNAKAGA
jgi:pimeloyl-ACP methyl ester carboxylesterase